MASRAYKNNGAIFIWFDETEHGDSTNFTLPLVVISPLAKGNAYDSTLTYTHSSDLKTMEELFGVYGPGGAFLGDANNPATNNLSDLFVTGPTSATTAGPAVAGRSPATIVPGDLASMKNGLNEAGSLVFSLTEPNGLASRTDKLLDTQIDTASDVLTTRTVVPGAFAGNVSNGGDAAGSAQDQGLIAELLVHKSDTDTIADSLWIRF
jgi:hypothetical protein